MKDKRIFCTGDKADELFVIVRGQVAILYPKAQIHDLQKSKTFEQTVIGMREKYVAKAIEERIFITNLQAKKEDEVNQDELDLQKKAEARKKLAMETNETYQMFDKMLGLEPNPTILECQANNPLLSYTKELNERLLNPDYRAS